LPASIFAIPLVNAVLERYGFPGGFYAITLLSLGTGLVRVATTNIHVQVLGFVFFALFRAYLYGVSYSFLPVLLGDDVVGKAAGIMYFVTGITAFLNIPLANLAIRYDDFFFTNMIYLALVIPTFFASIGIHRGIIREDRAFVAAKQQQPKDDNNKALAVVEEGKSLSLIAGDIVTSSSPLSENDDDSEGEEAGEETSESSL